MTTQSIPLSSAELTGLTGTIELPVHLSQPAPSASAPASAHPRARHRIGLLFAVTSAVTFGTSGTVATSLLGAGWSPLAAVTARVALGTLILTVPAAIALRGRWRALWADRTRVLLYGVFAVAGAQLGYFAAVQRIPVALALLIEYLAPVGLVVVLALLARRVPPLLVIGGALVSVTGLALIIVPRMGGIGALDPLGILFALLAAVGCAVYFVLGAKGTGEVPPVGFAAAGLLVGGVTLGLTGLTGLVPFTATTRPAHLGALELPSWAPLLILGLVSTAIPYVLGTLGAERLGARAASFVGLIEVLAAIGLSWLLLGQALSPLQLAGAVGILAGVLLVQAAPPSESRRAG